MVTLANNNAIELTQFGCLQPTLFSVFLKSPVLIISIPMAWAVYKHAFHRAVKVFTTNLTWVCLVIPVQNASALLEVVQPWSTDSVQAF